MTSDSSGNVAVYENLKRAANQFSLFRDELRLQMHLANMEAKTSFERLEPNLRQIQNEINRALKHIEQKEDETELKLHLALMDAHTRFQAMEEWLSSRLGQLRETKSKAHESWDASRLQMHLASMDTEDYIKEKRSNIRSKIRTASEQARLEMIELAQHLADRITALRNEANKQSDDSTHLKP